MKDKLLKNLPVIVLLLISIFLRLVNLGYSDYQGDEIKSFVILEDQSLSQFLLDQRKGPGQFFVTYLVSLVNPNYDNEFLTRLPFAIAGIASVIAFYYLVFNLFNKKVGFYSAFFLATNGFFVAFSRISQYQSFVILFMVLSLLYFYKAIIDKKYITKGIFLGFLFWAFSILFHYDGVFIFPFAFYLIFLWFKKHNVKLSFKNEFFVGLFKSLVFSGILLSLFYVPYVLTLAKSTLDYWEGRITGDVSSKISSSKYLFTVYQPIYVIHFYTLLALAGFASLFQTFIRSKIKVLKFIPKFEFSTSKSLAIFVWMLIPLIFLEVIVYIPGTHIYAYLIPLFIFLSFGLVLVEDILKKFKKYILSSFLTFLGITILFSFIFLQSFAIFVDNKQEYPWESERFYIWEFHQPTPIFHLSMFGFPYYRNWEGIRDLVQNMDHNGYYSTNERKSIARYYVPLEKSTDDAGLYIHILNPQSFTNSPTQDKANYWIERYTPIFTTSRSTKDIVRVYYMQPGKLKEIQEKGF